MPVTTLLCHNNFVFCSRLVPLLWFRRYVLCEEERHALPCPSLPWRVWRRFLRLWLHRPWRGLMQAPRPALTERMKPFRRGNLWQSLLRRVVVKVLSATDCCCIAGNCGCPPRGLAPCWWPVNVEGVPAVVLVVTMPRWGLVAVVLVDVSCTRWFVSHFNLQFSRVLCYWNTRGLGRIGWTQCSLVHEPVEV